MIEVHNLTKRHGRTLAVDDLSFRLHPGLVTGFLGPNGAGKSTTMRMILGLDTPTAGEALIGGRAYRRYLRPLLVVGSLLDGDAFHAGRTARDHLGYLAASNGIAPSRAAEVLEQTGLGDVARKRVGTFSMGMKQRLGIAAALLGDPEILVLDEPGNGLDAEGVVWLRELLRSLARAGRTVFVSSHLMSEMSMLADHLILIAQGRLIADVSTRELIAAAQPKPVLVRSPGARALAGHLVSAGGVVTPLPDGRCAVTGIDSESISTIAAERGIAIHGLAQEQTSLEEAYLAITEGAVEFQAHHLSTHAKDGSRS